MRRLAFPALTLCYPLAIWLLGDQVQPRWLALSLILLGALRVAASGQKVWMALALVAFALAAVTGILNVGWPLRWYPVFVNTACLVAFGATVLKAPSMAERFARLSEPDLPPYAIVYTRKVTIAWCGFFAFNGLVAAATCVWGTAAQWAFYNGGLAYALMAIFAAAEYAIRLQVKKSHATAGTQGS